MNGEKAEVDFHIHTTFSDGSLTPEQVVAQAAELGIKAVAITDHDNIDGIDSALKVADRYNVKVVPGVELSVEYSRGQMHLLGYFIDHKNEELNSALNWMKEKREQRNPQIIKKLRQFNIPITLDMVKEVSGEGVVGRPHIAQVLLDLGWVQNWDEAFDRYIGSNGAAYVPKVKMDVKEAIAYIKGAGGIPVFAHPVYVKRAEENFDALLRELIEFGLEGLEVWYSSHSQNETDDLAYLADKYKLLKTGGSDFHGDCKPDIILGAGFNNLTIPFKVYENLYEFWKKSH